MSGRTVPRLALVGLLTAAFAAPAAAQEGGFQPPVNADGLPTPLNAPKPMPQAPMPRAKTDGHVQIELTFDANNEAQLQWSVAGAPVMPPPRKPDCCRQQAAPPVMAQPRQPAIIGYEVIEYSTTPLQSPPCPVSPPPIIRHFGIGCGSLAPQSCTPAKLVMNERNFDLLVVPAAPPSQLPPLHPGSFVVGVGGAACPACPATPAQHQAWQPCPAPVARPLPACPGVTDATKQVAADAFFDMLKQSGFLAAPQPPAPRTVPYPTPGVLSGAPAAPRRAGIVGTGAIGTWYRDLGAKRCVIAVEHDHMTITVSESREIDEKTVTAHITFTADYHLARDGSTAVGLITGVDMSFDGDVPEQETDAMMESIAELRKAMEDRPFAMNCRLYGQTLVIGNVRMPEWKDQREQPSSYIAGRYASAATKPMPKQKVMKAPDAKAVPVYAPPAYNPLAGAAIGAVTGAGVGAPVGLPTVPGACPTVPAGSLLPPPSTPAPVPVVRPYGEWVAPTPAVVPSMPEPTPPAPTMSEPVPPNLSATPALGPIGTALDFAVPLNKGPYDHKQLFNFSLGLFGSDADSASPLTPTLEAVGPLPPPLGPDTAPPVADGSFLQGLTSAKPIRQLFSFTTGLFGSQ